MLASLETPAGGRCAEESSALLAYAEGGRGREGKGGRDSGGRSRRISIYIPPRSGGQPRVRGFEGSRVRGSRVRIPGLTPKGSSALGVWVATRHPVTSCGLSEEGLCANFARDMRAAPRAVVEGCRGGAGIPSRGRYLRRCPRDPWDLFCFHLQTREKTPVFCWEARNVPFRGVTGNGNQRSREVSMRVSSPSVPFMR